MRRNWAIVPKDSWRHETERYRSRLEKAAAVDKAASEAIMTYFPGSFFPGTESPRQVSVASRLGIYAANLFALATQVRAIVRDQWLSGNFVVVPLNARFVLETWGAIHFAWLTFERLKKEGDLQREEERTNRLTFGARSPIELPWGGNTDLRSFNVLDFIRGLEDVRPDAEELYGFLSEASHPNLIQNTYFHIAGPPISNWDNEAFSKHGHFLLNRTLEIFETTTRGMEQDIVHILKEGTEYIHKFLPEPKA